MQQFIKNAQPRLQSICVIEYPPEGSKLKPRRHTIQLEPGANPVEKKIWDLALAQKQPAIEALLATGKLVELGPTPDGSIAALKEPDAIKVVEETYSLRLLKTWLDAEKRPRVSAALRKRLEEHEAATKVEEKKP